MKILKNIKDILHKIITKSKNKMRKPSTSIMVCKELLIIAVCIQLALEMMGHRSIIDGLMTPLANPLMFICSVFFLSSCLAFSLFLSKRHFGYICVSTIWLWLGFTNFILLSFRTTPLTATDFKMLSSVFTVVNRYVSTLQMVLIVLFALSIVVSLIFVGIRLPLTKIYLRRSIVTIGMCFLLFTGSYNAAVMGNAVTKNFGNIAEAFLDYGFAYSFSRSVVDKGIQRPKTYSSETVGEVLGLLPIETDCIEDDSTTDDLLSNVNTVSDKVYGDKLATEVEINTIPNIVFVQLESFFDVNRIKALEFNTNPLPNMTKLMANYSSGYVTVPSIGAGTANTEFEILSGMSLDYFGAGEYPYKTILKKSTVESLPYTLTELDYHNHAIHNNMGTFYARNSVYPRLGFDSFSSIEYMQDIEYNPLNWAKDKVLIPEITKALQATQEQDFIFAVSVQPHGKYPAEPIIDDPVIVPSSVTGAPAMISNDLDSSLEEALEDKMDLAVPLTSEEPLEEVTYNKYLYYANQVYETDVFVGDLIQTLEDFPEPIVVVFYGDHMPSLDITDEDLKDGTPFQIEYVIWDNMGLEKTNEDLMAYQMGSNIMERLGYSNGLLNVFHQTMKDTENYEEELQLLQYDMLYGDKNVYGGINPFKKKKMKMGVDPINILDVADKGEAIIVNGQNFTMWSEVFINSEQSDTVFLDSQTLLVPHVSLEPNTTVKVSQITRTGRVLSSCDPWTNEIAEVAEEPVELELISQ
ncbi:Phosphoglycerol transferase MdoB [Dethiosulfatibacter aminovorans DSM 17477]|uniref:Phosphoglycerol transferase MdoB n=1 Tax=Dethiosulfatibacter aminovorans DSM 17477 TaxID=1121476 RepID=A0A1M6JTF5_9FIRM|nr:alkaline phosphatase family protein [Dethiosulfatibacter aminovorans]SHJ49959.1 Phosphoglycerol transferase MdoB [Dethiosulfatibacter aminovorans DSM 17477]